MLKQCDRCKRDFNYIPMSNNGTRGFKRVENGVKYIFICQECLEKIKAKKEEE